MAPKDEVKKIYSKVRGMFFRNPWKLYKKEVHLTNQPFFFEGTNGRAILMIHGWSSTSYELRRLGVYLNENGYTVNCPMLRGHGTVPRDLEGVRWRMWVSDLEDEYRKLRKSYRKVYVIGTSIGSLLGIHLARKNSEIPALVLMATPYSIKLEKISIFSAKVFRLFKKYNKKFYPPTFGSKDTITRLISYQSYPVDSALEVFDLVCRTREIFPEIKQPCFMLQSTSDHVVGKDSLENIYRSIGSKKKKKKYIRRAYHTFISDIKNEKVFQDILDFISSV